MGYRAKVAIALAALATLVLGGHAISQPRYSSAGPRYFYEQSADPGAMSSRDILYSKDDGGDTELFFKDPAANVIQFTKDGSIPAGSISAPGADTQVIYNDGGAFGAEAGFTYVKGTDTLTAVVLTDGAAQITAGALSGVTTISNAGLISNTSGAAEALRLSTNGTDYTKFTMGADGDLAIESTDAAAAAANISVTADGTWEVTSTGYNLTGAGAISGVTDIGLTGSITTATDVSMTGELDMTGAGAAIDLNPSATGTQQVLDITPTAALVAGNEWDGINLNGNALDPLTGGATLIHGYHANFTGVVSADGDDARIQAFRVQLPTGDTGISRAFAHAVNSMTVDGEQVGFASLGATATLNATATYNGGWVDWDGITRTGGAPILQGLTAELPVDYTGFGASYAGYFSGGGDSVTIADGTYAIVAAGNVNVDDGVVNSPILYLTDEDNNYLAFVKNDAGESQMVNNEGAIYIQSSGDTDDHISISTAAGVVTFETLATDDGDLVIAAGGGDISFSDDNLSGTGTLQIGDITTGADGADGKLTIYSEQGVTDYTASFAPHVTMTETTDYLLPAAYATGAQYLSDDGAGNLSWATPAGAGDITDVGDCDTGACFTAAGTGNSLWFEGATPDDFEVILTAEDATTPDKTLTMPQFTGYVVANVNRVTDLEGTALSVAANTLNVTEADPLSATKALDNLAVVAISESLVSDAASTDDLGTEALYWQKLFLDAEISFEGATDDAYQTTFSVTDPTLVDKTITFQDADGIVAMDTTAVNDLDGTLLSIAGGTLNATEADTLAAVTGRGATTATAVTFQNTVNIDDGVGDSPVFYLIDADNNYLGMVKDDGGPAYLVNNEGAIQLKPSNDSDDYFDVSTAAGVVTIQSIANDDGDLVIAAGGGDISFGDENLSGTGRTTFTGGVVRNRTAVNDAAYEALEADYIIAYTAISAARIITLTDALCDAGRVYIVSDEAGAAGTFNLTIDPEGGTTINGVLTYVINADNGRAEVYCAGATWFAN